jgi:hypothetical protein
MVAEIGLSYTRAVDVEVLAGRLQDDAADILRHKDTVRQVLRNVAMRTRSCILREEDIIDEIYRLVRDEDDAWDVHVSLYSILTYVNMRIDDVTVYKIYADEDDRTNDLFVVLFGGRQLTERQIEVLKEVASLYAAKLYDEFKEGKFCDASTTKRRKRTEVYVVLHNLVNNWVNCRDMIKE